MKVVLFCGGQGMRIREHSDSIPKPMVNVGYRPILWHIMKYYSHFGHREFILCLGWQANVIKDYFLTYNECVSNDFTLSAGGRQISLLSSDIEDWKITFVDTGIHSNIGERLKAVEQHLYGEEVFLANYSDSLTDLPLPKLIDFHHEMNALATFMSVRPTQSFHTVEMDDSGHVHELKSIGDAGIWMNAGFFVLNHQIFKHLNAGEELVFEPFERLIQCGRLYSYQYDGFFGCMDTYKEKQQLDDMYRKGDRPWEIWTADKQLDLRQSVAASAIAPPLAEGSEISPRQVDHQEDTQNSRKPR